MPKGRGSQTNSDPRAAIWAALTIAAFPLVALSMSWMGIHPLVSFLLGALASLLVLLVEGMFRRRLWISEPAIAHVLGDPMLGYRMLIVLGIILLVFETFLLAGFLTNPSFDKPIVRFILNRQCVQPENALFARLCATNAVPPEYAGINAAEAAIRDEAVKRYFPDGGLVTCSTIKLGEEIEPLLYTHSAIVRCDRWVVGKIAGHPVSVQTVQATIVARLRIRQDGSYYVQAWNDNPSSAEWSSIGQGIALTSLERQRKLASDGHIADILAMENFRRVMEYLSSK